MFTLKVPAIRSFPRKAIPTVPPARPMDHLAEVPELEQLLLAAGKDYGGAGPPSRTARFEALSA